MSTLAVKMQNRWPDALRTLGVDERFLRKVEGACPFCGGKDRFVFDNKEGRGTWFCRGCGGGRGKPGSGGAGDGLHFAMMHLNADFATVARRLEAIYPDLKEEAPAKPPAAGDRERRMRDLWCNAKPLDGDDLASRYLIARTGTWPDVRAYVRFAPACLYSPDDGSRTSEHPALLAKVIAPDNTWCNTHRTYLAPKGGKAAVNRPKKLMQGEITHGAAIRLARPGVTLAIAEGLETALAFGSLHGVPCWAAVSAGMMVHWTPPEGVERVIVAGDADASFTGQAAAYELARRLVAKGIPTTVSIPEQGDWADVLASRQGAPA